MPHQSCSGQTVGSKADLLALALALLGVATLEPAWKHRVMVGAPAVYAHPMTDSLPAQLWSATDLCLFGFVDCEV